MSFPKIQILMGVYNGAVYLDEALESVAKQDFMDWQLLVRDDGSTDETLGILDEWSKRLGDRLRIIPNTEKVNLGMNGNYSRLLLESTAPYVTLISHDDIYYPEKLSKTMWLMEQHENSVGVKNPILVYTDLSVIDERGDLVAPSHWEYTGWRPPTPPVLGKLIVHSAICGGSCLINRPLIQLLGAEPLCEDVWIALVAATMGDLVVSSTRTVGFRWHSNNQSQQVAISKLIQRVLFAPWEARGILHRQHETLRPRIRRFLEIYRNHIRESDAAALEAFLELPMMGPIARRIAVFRHRLFYASWIRNLGLIVLI